MGALNNVLTLPEISEKTGTAESTIKTWIAKNKIPKKYYRKTSKGTYLFDKTYIKFKENQDKKNLK